MQVILGKFPLLIASDRKTVQEGISCFPIYTGVYDAGGLGAAAPPPLSFFFMCQYSGKSTRFSGIPDYARPPPPPC